MTTELRGCSDHGCLIDPPVVGTAGGRCRCLETALSRLTPDERRLVRALLIDRLRLRDALLTLSEDLNTARDLCRAVVGVHERSDRG